MERLPCSSQVARFSSLRSHLSEKWPTDSHTCMRKCRCLCTHLRCYWSTDWSGCAGTHTEPSPPDACMRITAIDRHESWLWRSLHALSVKWAIINESLGLNPFLCIACTMKQQFLRLEYIDSSMTGSRYNFTVDRWFNWCLYIVQLANEWLIEQMIRHSTSNW